MANEVDLLMDLDPLEYSAMDIEKIIAYQRQQRANSEAGTKPKKETGPKLSLDLQGLGLTKPKLVEPMKRRL